MILEISKQEQFVLLKALISESLRLRSIAVLTGAELQLQDEVEALIERLRGDK